MADLLPKLAEAQTVAAAASQPHSDATEPPSMIELHRAGLPADEIKILKDHRDGLPVEELARERARRLARRTLDLEEATATLNLPPLRESYTLASYRAQPRQPRVMRVDSLQGERHNVVLVAAYKVGKTTLDADLVRSLVDGGQFLQRFAVTVLPEGERVAVWNAEMDANDYEDYLAEAGVINGEQVAIWNLRGFSVPILSDAGCDEAIRWLKSVNARYWLIDPWVRVCAWNGVNENENNEVSELTQRIDEIAAAAGVIEVQIVHHAGHGSKHARGASALPAWADAIWTYERDDDGDRYLSAEGRNGVGLAPGLVTVGDDGRLTCRDAGPRQTAAEKTLAAVVGAVEDAPGRSLKMMDLYAAVDGANAAIRAAVKAATEAGRLEMQTSMEDKRVKLLVAAQPSIG